jgi:WD40 repeat protein
LKNLMTVNNIQNCNHVYFSNASQVPLILYWFLADPTVFSGHTSGIRHVIFFRSDTHLVTCADDRTLRVWDRISGQVCTCYYWGTHVGVNPGHALWSESCVDYFSVFWLHLWKVFFTHMLENAT